MTVSKVQERLSKALQAAVMKSITYHRRIGSLGAGNLKHSKVKSLAMPIAMRVKRSPRMPACIAAVEKMERTLAICPANKDPKAWAAAEGSKLHSWLLRATRWEHSCLSEQTLLHLLLPQLWFYTEVAGSVRKQSWLQKRESKSSNEGSTDNGSDSSSSSGEDEESDEDEIEDEQEDSSKDDVKQPMCICVVWKVVYIITTYVTTLLWIAV